MNRQEDGVFGDRATEQHHRISKPSPGLHREQGNDSDVARPCPSLCRGINEDVLLIHMYRYVEGAKRSLPWRTTDVHML